MITKVELPANLQNWLRLYEEKHGRSVRVLHIGNIANNAYINAKLLNQAGLDCDVICYDYYHIMGCPEWEDADFEGQIDDQFFPNWLSVNLNGFKRPTWFAQGPLRVCIFYLNAKRRGKIRLSRFWWKVLEFRRWFTCSPLGHYLRRRLINLRDQLAVQKLLLGPWRALDSRWGEKLIALLRVIRDSPSCLNLLPLLLIFLPINIFQKFIFRFQSISSGKYSFAKRMQELVELFHQKFPDRQDRLSQTELKDYQRNIILWQRLFANYDIIQAYSTDTILPLLANEEYLALEHGTLREIPFQQTPQGRMTALSYHLANHVFVTNSDCLENAKILANGKVSFINHPYDEDHGINREGWKDLRRNLCKQLDASFLFFFPTRQDWIPGTGYSDKANDVFLRAFVELRRKGHKIGMVCCNWGANVKQSQQILLDKGCGKYVVWKEPMGTVSFERTSLACHIVVDQFKLGSFGGILFKAMATGVPVMTYLDKNRLLKQYPEMPPVINCSSREEIVARVADLINSPEKLREIGNDSRDWIKQYHSKNSTVNLQVDQFRRFLSQDDTGR